MFTKSELKRLWDKYNFIPRKRMGQNFLVDKNIKNKIISSLDLNARDIIIEIGSGFGEMTIDFAEKAKYVYAVEKDKRIVNILKNEINLPQNVIFVEDDFLNMKLENAHSAKNVIIYGNIPYYITSPILEKIFANIVYIKHIYLVVQQEVGWRILSCPGSKNTSRLSFLVWFYTVPRFIFKINRTCFYPTPNVDSILLGFEITKKGETSLDEQFLFEVVKIAFSQRRKKVLNALSDSKMEKEYLKGIFRDLGIPLSARPEELSIEDFKKLSGRIQIDKIIHL